MPAAPFSAVLPARYLLSGDEELLSARLFLKVRVADPIRFFQEVAIQ